MTSLHELTRPPEPPRTLRPSRRATARKRGPHDAGYLLGPDTVEDFEQIGLADDEAERSDEEETGLSGTDLAPTSTSDNEDASFRVPAAKLILEDWEDRIAWEQPKRTRPLSSLQRDSEESKTLSEDWTSAILWDSPANYWKATAIPSPHLPTTFSLDLDLLPPNPYNVSNDKFYEVHEKKGMRRKGATQAVLQHSTPALLLEHPFYRTSVTVEKIRHFHRPLFRRPAEDIFLNPLKPAKKRRTEGGGPPKTLKELTLGDRNPFVLFEYSEEHPPFLSNIGMGALIQNYYRKRDPRDTHLAEFPDGEPQVLDAEHGASVEDGTLPFTIANVEPGTSLQALTTNMFRAPIFAHSTNHSDFLIIR